MIVEYYARIAWHKCIESKTQITGTALLKLTRLNVTKLQTGVLHMKEILTRICTTNPVTVINHFQPKACPFLPTPG